MSEYEEMEREEAEMYDPLRTGRRREDHNLFAKIVKLGMKYNWLVTLIALAFLALGFDFKTPASLFAEIRKDLAGVKETAASNKDIAAKGLDSVKTALDAANQDNYTLKTLLESSVTAQCLYLPKNVSRTAGLPCARLFRERGIE